MDWMLLMAMLSAITGWIAFIYKRKLGVHFLKASLALMAMVGFQQVHGDHGRGLGLRPPTQEVLDHVQENWPNVVGVKPNKVGIERIQDHRKDRGLHPLMLSSADPADEVIVVVGKDAAAASVFEAGEAGASLPPRVNNSELPSFPPIGDQKQLGSCVGWGTTYYQATHEYGLLHGLNNKTSFKNVFSPKWTYNNLNGGQDGGLDIFSTYELFSQNGVVSIASFPYDTNFRAWDLNPKDWVDAVSFRSAPGQLVSGIGGDTQNLDVIKQLLNNGHILTFGTFIESWVTDKVKADPAAASNPHAGELAAAWMNGYNGGHCMTIVGYDDDIWIDINKNGKVDPGEKGAFLIANSWGTDWGNHGFVWIAYDAFLSRSAVPNGPSRGRVPLAAAMDSQVVSAVPLQYKYSPKLIAQFSLSQSVRNQISVEAGISETNSTVPLKKFKSCAVYNQGGRYEFDGTTSSAVQTATFALDLTDLIKEVPSPTQRYYLIIKDSAAGQPTVINSFKLIDKVHGTEVNCSSVPVKCDGNQAIAYVDYSYSDDPTPPAPTPPAPTPPTPPAPVPPPPAPTPPKVKITSPLKNQFVSGTIWVTVNATDVDGIDRVEFYIDGVLCSVDSVAPYQILLNTRGMYPGVHEITAIAYDKTGASAASTVDVYVFNFW